MTTQAKPAKVGTSRTLASTVWLIPILAALTGGYLFVQSIRDRGPEITLLLDNADGIEVNTTAIKVLNVEVGRVSKVRLRPDQQGVEITARLNKDAADWMREDTQFWIVKPRIDNNGISGLRTLVSGSYISFTPGSSDKEAREFTVSELPPVTAIGQSGLRLFLSGHNSKMVSVGSPVMYENHTVGTVESAKFNPADQTVRYTVFIESPNETLISEESEFWVDSGMNVKLESSGVNVHLPPMAALLSGAVSFRTPQRPHESSKPVQNGHAFKIHNNRSEIDQLPGARTLYYTLFFDSSVRGLNVGAPVEYKGIPIGTVADVPYFADGDSLNMLGSGLIPVRIRIEPAKLEMNAPRQSKEFWQARMNAALQRGLTATLASNNLVLGSKMIELDDKGSGAVLRPNAHYGGYPVIGTRHGGLDDLQAQVGKLLAKLNALPLDKTVGELNGSLRELRTMLASADKAIASVDKVVGQPSVARMPAELNQTLTELRQTLQGVSPQSPVYQDVRQTLQRLDRTLQEAQPLLNTLKEQPNSLIFNSSTHDPIPKGNR